MSSDAIDDEPAAPLPTPAWSCSCFLKQSIVHANDGSNHEQLLRYFMWNAEGKFFPPAIYIHGSYLQVIGPVWSRSVDDLTAVHLPNVMTRGLETARTLAAPRKKQSVMRKEKRIE
jgi:hypothetical protein